MKTINELTKDQLTEIKTFLNGLQTEHIYINDYVSASDIDFERPFESMMEKLNEQGAFNVEIIYYLNAIEYLKQNDSSLQESLEIASDLGYEVSDLNSELLASLLASHNNIIKFCELETEINEFFKQFNS